MNALVLGGGGPVGVAWTSALLHGLVSAGLPLDQADVVLGTSAGSVAGAWLTMTPDGLPELPGRMVDRARWHAANAKSGYGDKNLLRRAMAQSTSDTESARSIGQAAVAAIPPISSDQAEELWKATLPEGPWSPRLRIAAVNAETGQARAWSAADGVSLAVAVSCSTAAPGVAPPVTVAGSVWVDGGVRSGTNADLLVDLGGSGRVLVLAPVPNDNHAREADILAAHGFQVRVITATPFYQAVSDLLDPQFVDVAVAAGASQAGDIAEDLTAWWRG
ncbi:patatin-like phospholipase family protein [Kutzneria sp. CA-103260]|uniref:patatin-like phospholipase family protein n=1 Tax=Kutzneria sp. CA-103260 TaxID=2802641 RepID=UPI001BADB7CE|nr:patatin-like phospholipase family protein [Kutzneria sp. CA-103260]QUQ65718.1 patatin-like phospholipase [Kutzneria sp. CA-103260]